MTLDGQGREPIHNDDGKVVGALGVVRWCEACQVRRARLIQPPAKIRPLQVGSAIDCLGMQCENWEIGDRPAKISQRGSQVRWLQGSVHRVPGARVVQLKVENFPSSQTVSSAVQSYAGRRQSAQTGLYRQVRWALILRCRNQARLGGLVRHAVSSLPRRRSMEEASEPISRQRSSNPCPRSQLSNSGADRRPRTRRRYSASWKLVL